MSTLKQAALFVYSDDKGVKCPECGQISDKLLPSARGFHCRECEALAAWPSSRGAKKQKPLRAKR